MCANDEPAGKRGLSAFHMSTAWTPRNASGSMIAEIDAESGARGDERALMKRLAVDQRAVDVPGDRAKEAHDATSSDRSARRR